MPKPLRWRGKIYFTSVSPFKASMISLSLSLLLSIITETQETWIKILYRTQFTKGGIPWAEEMAY
jgi:hypothetical protein